jgi:type II secretory pathway predicted ATPase ExeA
MNNLPKMADPYFGFSDPPFADNDARFLFLGHPYKEILESLFELITGRENFIVISGSGGTGKTTLVNVFLKRLPASVQAISNPSVNSSGIMYEIGAALSITHREDEYFDLNEFERALVEADLKGKCIILVVDNAHLLSDHDLEVIRLFSNIERNGQKLLKILLLGTNELRQRLDSRKLQHIRDSITLNYYLSPLNPHQTIAYIDHYLKVVGSSIDSCFARACHDVIYKITEGFPHRINQVCNKALQTRMEAEIKLVNKKILSKLDQPSRPGLFSSANILGYGSPWMAIGMGLVILAFIGLIGFRGFLSISSKQVPQKIHPAGKDATDTSSPLADMQRDYAAAPEKVNSVSSESGGQLPPSKIAEPEPDRSETNMPVISGTATGESPSKPEPSKSESRSYQISERDKSLTDIAASRYPGHEKVAIEAMILANPEIVREDLISPRQIIRLPQVFVAGNRFQLDDGLFYAPYGRYYAPLSLQRYLSWLDKKQIRHIVRQTQETDGRTLNRVFLGGYETEADLIKAQQGIVKKN